MTADHDELDLALRHRLRQLSARPVDTARLDAALARELNQPPSALSPTASLPLSPQVHSTTDPNSSPIAPESDLASRSRRLLFPSRSPGHQRRFRLARPLTVAASLLLGLVAVAAILNLSSRPALAEPTSMAQLHNDLISGRLPMTRVASIAQANELLSSKWPEAPEIPALSALPPDHELACCLKDLKGRRVVCVVLTDSGVPISIVIAPRGDLKSPGPSCRMAHTSGTVNMVMKETPTQWICIMGEVPIERLNAIADQMVAR